MKLLKILLISLFLTGPAMGHDTGRYHSKTTPYWQRQGQRGQIYDRSVPRYRRVYNDRAKTRPYRKRALLNLSAQMNPLVLKYNTNPRKKFLNRWV